MLNIGGILNDEGAGYIAQSLKDHGKI